MYLFVTEIKAIDPIDGELKTWAGPKVPGISFNDAEAYCQNNELGYCKVIGRFIGEFKAPSNEQINDPFSRADIEGAFDQWRIDQN